MTRAELYALVWEQPSTHVARRLGISAARLRKICEDYQVPLPPAGHWTKRAHGKTVDQPPLPQPTSTFLNRINSALRRFGEVPLQFADEQISAFELDLGTPESEARPERPSSVMRLAEVLQTTKPDEHGFVSVNDETLPAVHVGGRSIGRVLALLEAFIVFLTGRGYAVSGAPGPFRIMAAGEPLALKLYETRTNEPDSNGGGRARSYVPSGKLCMEIHDSRPLLWRHRNLVGQWHDRHRRPLERCFDEATVAIAGAVHVIKQRRALAEEDSAIRAAERDRAQEAERREELARRRDAYLKAKAEELANYEKLVRLSEHLSKSTSDHDGSSVQRLRSFLENRLRVISGQFEIETLSAEIVRLKLFDPED